MGDCLIGRDIDGLGDWVRQNGLPAPPIRLSADAARSVAERSASNSSMTSSRLALSADRLVTALSEAGWTYPVTAGAGFKTNGLGRQVAGRPS